jgi:uncharacterized protein with beta-barrel porin domain
LSSYFTGPQAIDASFINDPSQTRISVLGEPVDKSYIRLGFGMSLVFTKGRSGFFYYEKLLGREGVDQYSLAGGIRIEF